MTVVGKNRGRSGETPTAGPRLLVPTDVFADATVLVVDDDAVNVMLLERLLLGAGVGTVRGLTDSTQAVREFVDLQPDLVMLDLHMPVADGLCVLDQLRAVVPDDCFLPVLMLTGDSAAEVRDQALAAGAKDFVNKPFDPTEVVLRAKNLVETRALHESVRRHNAALRSELHERTKKEAMERAERVIRRRRVERVLTGDAMGMVFQPITDLACDAVVGVEALARFASAPRRPPNEWFAEAAEVGLGADLELAAVRAALSAVDRFSPEVFVSVNVSPSTVLVPEFTDLLARGPLARIVVELTEHHRIDSYEPLLEVLDRLRRRGVRTAVDDAGAGYAGLQHILRLRPDVLKLDRNLIRGIDRDPARRALASALVRFAADIGSMIIAEGVETLAELDTIRALGVPCAQGYLLGRPGPAAPEGNRRENGTEGSGAVSPAAE